MYVDLADRHKNFNFAFFTFWDIAIPDLFLTKKNTQAEGVFLIARATTTFRKMSPQL
jgi:hypothetical protein